MKKTSFSKNQQGLNLIELLLVLAIVVAIAVAAFVIYPRVQAGRAASSNSQIISAALAQVQSIFQNGVYSNLDNTVAAQADVFPDSFVVDPATGVLANEFAPDATNNVTIFGSDAAGGVQTNNAARFVTITYGDVPSRVCMKLVPGLAANFGRITVNGVEVVNKLNVATTDDIIDEGVLVTNCNGLAAVDVVMTAR